LQTIFCFWRLSHVTHHTFEHISWLSNFFLLSFCLSICYNSKVFLALPLVHLLPKTISQSLVHLLCLFFKFSFVSLVHLLYPFVFLSMFFLIHVLHLWIFFSTFFCGKLKCDYCCQSYFHVVIVLYLHVLISYLYEVAMIFKQFYYYFNAIASFIMNFFFLLVYSFVSHGFCFF